MLNGSPPAEVVVGTEDNSSLAASPEDFVTKMLSLVGKATVVEILSLSVTKELVFFVETSSFSGMVAKSTFDPVWSLSGIEKVSVDAESWCLSGKVCVEVVSDLLVTSSLPGIGSREGRLEDRSFSEFKV